VVPRYLGPAAMNDRYNKYRQYSGR